MTRARITLNYALELALKELKDRRDWTAEDLRVQLRDSQLDLADNAMGGILRNLYRNKQIAFVGYQRATRSAAKGHVLRTWRVR